MAALVSRLGVSARRGGGGRGHLRPGCVGVRAQAVQPPVGVNTTTSNAAEQQRAALEASTSAGASLAAINAPVADDLVELEAALRSCVGERHPTLMAAADQIFGAGGKKLRPTLCFLVARATAKLEGLTELNYKHRRIAEVAEMLHTASLVHDDVLDECDLRRGKATVHSLYGTRVAVLVGDFLFAQASWFLAEMENIEVIKLISQVIADFANGEVSQAGSLFDTEVTLEQYVDKSYYKTASLIAASLRSAAVFSGCKEDVKHDMFEYGRHLGIAFQVVDDILDFTQTEEQLGKPQGQDLASGNLTCPVIFALRESDELAEIVDSEFQDDGSLDRALQIVLEEGGIEKARQFARQEGDLALAALEKLPVCDERRSLELCVEYVLERLN